MTEEQLRQHILSATDAPDSRVQVPFATYAFPLHPNEPIDYELVRAEAYKQILGDCDGVVHPVTGAPHVDVYRHAPTTQRPFWCYVTNGMSDFPQLHADGSSFRSEMMCASSEEWELAAELIRVLGIMPFQDDTFLHQYHTVPFPDGVGDPRFTYIMTTPPFLVKELAHLTLLDEPLIMMSVIRITGGRARDRCYAIVAVLLRQPSRRS